MIFYYSGEAPNERSGPEKLGGLNVMLTYAAFQKTNIGWFAVTRKRFKAILQDRSNTPLRYNGVEE